MLPPDGLRLGVGLCSPASNKTRAPRLKLTAARNRSGVNLLSGQAASRVSRSRTERARRAYIAVSIMIRE